MRRLAFAVLFSMIGSMLSGTIGQVDAASLTTPFTQGEVEKAETGSAVKVWCCRYRYHYHYHYYYRRYYRLHYHYRRCYYWYNSGYRYRRCYFW